VSKVLEVIVTGLREAAIAAAAGADRLELVTAFERGGLTPDLRVVDDVARTVTVPVHVMVRPHDRSFCYTRAERYEITETAARMRNAGASAIVFGALELDRSIDLRLVEDVAGRANLPLTFHRAFDHAHDLREAYAQLATLPAVTRVLTAGGAADAWSGRALLHDLIAQRRAPEVLVGGGITVANLRDVVRRTGAREVHVGNAARTEGKIDGTKIEALATLLKLPSPESVA